MNEVLTAPRRFFARAQQRQPSPLMGFGVTMAALFLTTLAKEAALREVPSAAGLTFHVPWWVMAPAAGFFGALFIWGALTFGLALVLGDSARTAEWVGWAFAPFVIAGLLELVVAALWPAQVQPPPRPDQPLQILLWSAQVQTMAQETLPFIAFTVLEAASVGWGGYLLFTATRLEKPGKATVTAAVFVTFMLGFWLLRNYPTLRFVAAQ